MIAVVLLAKAEIRRRWPALVALALLAATGGALVTSSVALARRTVTSFDRLAEATDAADAQVFVNVGADEAEAVAALPGVAASWTVDLGVGALDGQRVYVGMIAGQEPAPPGLVRPLVVEGRAPDPESTDEIMVSQERGAAMAAAGIGLGDSLALRFLTAQDYRSFDTGFDQPGGPRVVVRLVGVYQMTGGAEGAPPVIASPGFSRAHPDALEAGRVVFLRLADGQAGVARLQREIDDLADEVSVPRGAEEFDPFRVEVPGESRDDFDTTARVLAGALAVLAGVVTLVALVLLAQGFSRYHGATNEAEVVHSALGVTTGQLLGARLLAATPVAAGAALAVVLVAVASSTLEPLGSLRAFEPHPGRAANVAVIAAGAAVTAITVLAVAAVTMAFSTRATHRHRRQGAPSGRGAGRWFAATPAAVGTRFALGTDRAAAPMRSAMVGVAVAVTGVAAGAVFGASLDRLVDTPARYGWGGDFAIVDADAAAAGRLIDDPDVAGATRFTQSTLRVEDVRTDVTAYENLRGDAGWWISAGSLPTAPDQVMLEPRLADRLGVAVGDEVTAGPAVVLRVVGLGIGPTLGDGGFGEQALVTPAGAARLAGTSPFTEIVVEVAPGRSVDRVLDRYRADYEVAEAEPPAEVANLAQLGRLPEVLVAFVAVIGVAALANALWVSARRRRRDLAVLRVMGHTPRQSAATVVAMGAVATMIGVAVGLPLGLALGRTVWRVVAEHSAVAGDSLVTVAILGGLPVAALVAAGVVAVPVAWRVARRAPARALRSE